MKTMRAFALILLGACGGAGNATLTFRVETPTTTPDGRDLDDAPPSVVLAVGDRALSAGRAFGTCAALDSTRAPAVRDTCRAHAPPGTIQTLACGDDPHVDEVACIYAVRARDTVELWRRDAELSVADGEPTRASMRPPVRVGALPVPRNATVTAGRVEYRR